MRALSALLQALTAALVITGCSGPGSVQAKPPAAPIASPPRVGCDQTIQQTGAPGGRIVLGVLAVPPAHLPTAVPSGSRPWRYFRKYGLAIRAGSPAVLITQIPGHDSIAAAARVLYEGRASALVQMLHKIEMAAGFTIIDRSSSPLAPTAAGREFIQGEQ